MDRKERNVNPFTSEKPTGIRISSPAEYAAGPEAIKVAMEHAIREMGPVRAFQALAKMNKKNGFDCPGCAWPDPDDKRSLLGEYCENGAKALAEEATLRKLDPEFFAKYSVEELSGWSDFEIGKSGRITQPMLLREGALHYEPVRWKEAFELIAAQLNALNSPDEAVFYTSGRSSNEAAFLFGTFIRAFGTNNMPDCSNMCHESSGVALSQTLGIGKGSVTLDDLHEAELVIIIGQNPGTNHPRMLTALEKLKANGGKIISVNPIREAGLQCFRNPQKTGGFFGTGTALTDVYLQLKINEDVALLKAISKRLIELETEKGGVLDINFIKDKTSGFGGLKEDLLKYDIQSLLNRSGIERKEFDKAVKIIAPARRIIVCWAMGLTQHENAVDNIRECVNLLLLKGSIGKKGAGTCPVRGHSNVQGDRTVGIMRKTTPRLASALKEHFDIDAPLKKGLDTVEAIQAMHEGFAKVFIALGGNFISAASDTAYTARALQKCDLTVQISTKLNRSHLVTGKTALILPTLGRSEKDEKDGEIRSLSVENSMGRVHATKGMLEPASNQLMSEPEIIGRIAQATLRDKTNVDWQGLGEDYNAIRQKISAVISGFESYNKKFEEGFYLPNNAREGDFSQLPEGKAIFSITALPDHELGEDEFLLMSIRSHDQFNTTIYGLDDRYRGVFSERRVLFMNPEDMSKMKLRELELVNLESRYRAEIRTAPSFHVVPYDIPRGNLACYFPEANVLIPIDQFARDSQTPVSKSVKVRVRKIG